MSTPGDKKAPTGDAPQNTSETSKFFTGCCLFLFALVGSVVGMVVGPIIAFERGAGDFDFIGIAPGLLVGGFVGFLVGFAFLALIERSK